MDVNIQFYGRIATGIKVFITKNQSGGAKAKTIDVVYPKGI
jgi:hypothetical protein|tara:strand:- start:99 stop:221 length:123 start_codon:yes stop_codon:yes gene_type:complete